MRIKKGNKSKKSRSNDWWTQLQLFLSLTKKYRFYPNCDLAATNANSLCDYYYDKKIDSLLVEKWTLPIKKKLIGWLNPPNDQIGPFMRKCYEQFRDFNIPTMMIVPSNVRGTKAWWFGIEDPKDRGEKVLSKPLKGRPKFLLRGKNSKYSSINSYEVVIWGRK